MTDVPISVEIESSKAKKGGEQVTRSLDDILKGAEKTNKELVEFNKSLTNSGLVSSKATDVYKKQVSAVKKVRTETEKAASASKTYNQSLNDATVLAKRATVAVTSYVAALKSKDVIIAIDNYNSLQNRIKLITKETGDYNRVSQELSRISKVTGTQIGLNADVFQRLSISAKELGANNTEILKVVQAVQQLGLEGDRSGAALNAGLTQFGQGLGGVLFRAEEFNSLIENVPEVANAIADGLGKTTSELQRAVSTGGVLSKDIFNSLLNQTDSIAQRASQIPLSLQREITNLKTSATELASAFSTSTGALSNVISLTQSITENLETLLNIVGVVAIAYASKFTVAIVANTAAQVANQIAMVKSTALAARTSTAYLGVGAAATKATVGVTAFSRALAFLGGPIGLAITAVAAGIFLVARNQRSATSATDLYNEAMKSSNDVLKDVEKNSEKVGLARIKEAQRATQAAIAQVNANRAIVASELTKAEQLRELQTDIAPFTASPFAFDDNFAGSAVRRAEKEVSNLTNRQDDLLKKLKELQKTLGDLGTASKKYSEEINTGANANKKAEDAVKKHIQTLKQQLELMKVSQGERRQLSALQRAENIAEQNKGKLLKSQKEEIINLTNAINELNNEQEQSKFVENLEKELQLIQLNSTEREVYKNILEAENIAKQNGVTLSEAERDRIKDVTTSIQDQKEALKEAEAQAKLFKDASDSIQDSLTDAFLTGRLAVEDFANFAKKQFAELASAAVMRVIINPVITQAAGALGGSGLAASVGNTLGVSGSTGVGGLGNLLSLGGLTTSLINPSTAVNLAAGAADIAQGVFGTGLGTQVAIEQGVQNFLGGINPANIAGGFAGGFLADSVFGDDRGIGATIGGGIGAIAGQALIPIPVVGAAIGSFLGNAVGGLFGGQPSSKEQFGVVDLSTGALVERGGLEGDKFSQENFDTVTALSDFAGNLAQQVGGVVENLTLKANNRAGLGVQFGTGPNTFFNTAEETLEAIVLGIAERANDIPESLGTAIDNINFDDAEQALQDINFALQFDKLFEETQPKFTELEIAVQGINDVFDESILTVRRLGLDEEKLNNARQDALNTLKSSFDESIQNQILSITNPEAASLTSLSEQQAILRRDALAIGGDIIALEELFALQRQQILEESTDAAIQSAEASLEAYKQTISSIEQLQNDLIFNTSLSGTNSAGRLAEADRQLDELALKISQGDVAALDELDTTVTQSLEAARAYYGTTAPYLERLATVDEILENAKDLAQNNLSIDEQLLNSAQTQEQVQQDLLDEAKKINEQLGSTSNDILDFQNISTSSLLNAGESASILTEINSVNDLSRELVRKAKFVASDGVFDFSSDQFGSSGISFKEFVQSQPNGQDILERFNNIIIGLGGTPQGFATGTGDRTITGMALVGEQGPELVNFGTPAQILSNTQSSNLLNNNGASEVIETGFSRMSRQSSEETVYLGEVLESILAEMQEMNDNIGLGGLKSNG